MTSTIAQNLSPEVFNEIEALFSWNPPHLELAPDKLKAKSTATRPPAFYDKHISAKLVVRTVVLLPSLLHDLAQNVDKVLEATSNALPRHLEGFITAEGQRRNVRKLSKVMRNETAVADFYHMTTATYCLTVASMLALHPSYQEWSTLLSWTKSAPSSRYAIMEGQLCFLEEGGGEDKAERDEMVNCIESKYRAIFEDVRNLELSLGTWEIKNLSTGSPEVISSIHNLGEFNWTFCEVKNCGETHRKMILEARKAPAGPDAQAPSWSIPEENIIPVEGRDEGTSIQPPQKPDIRRSGRLAVSSSSALLAAPQLSGASRSTDKGKKRKRDDDYQDPLDTTAQSDSGSLSLASEDVSPTKGKGKKRRVDDEAHHDRYDITAEKIVQQVTSSTIPVNNSDVSISICRHGHKPCESTGRSSSFILATKNSCVSAIETLRRFMFHRSSNHLRALTPDMGNSMSVYTSLPFKT